jgi:transposase
MDETPLKAGRREKGNLPTGDLWPLYGDQDEVACPFSASRAQAVVREAWGTFCGGLLTAGYTLYERFTQKVSSILPAPGWRHPRRQFERAPGAAPRLGATALDHMASFSRAEAKIRAQGLDGEAKLAPRGEDTNPLVDAFFPWLKQTVSSEVLLPANPFGQAARYALEREAGLTGFLANPDVPLDTNHLEREIRPSALGRKNWRVCWTAVGARPVGLICRLRASGRLQGVDPSVYLVDGLQRIDTHPALEVQLLTPRLGKQPFADHPLRSDLDRVSP